MSTRLIVEDKLVYERWVSAESAIKDILYMYYTCIDYRMLYSDMGTEDGKFDPFYFIDCAEAQTGYDTDFDLLHQGSAIKIACRILECWEQGGYEGFESNRLEQEKELVASGRMDHLPELKQYISDSLKCYSLATKGASAIYSRYVEGFFVKLIK
jgi:hypothetical protein